MKIRYSIISPQLLVTGVLLAAMPLAVTSVARADDTAAPDTEAPDTTAPDTTAPGTTAPGAAAPGTLPPGTYIWVWKNKKGEVQRTKSVTNITAKLPGTEVALHIISTELQKQTVKDVGENGDVTTEAVIESSEMTVNGETRTVNKPPITTTVVMDKRGIIKSFSSDGPTGAPDALTAVSAMLGSDPLPDHPVKLGESWSAEIDNRLMPGKKVTITSTLQRIVDANGVDLLKIHSKMSIPRPKEDVEIKVQANYIVDRGKGQVVSETATIDNAEMAGPEGQTLPVHIEVNESNVPDAVAPQGGPQPQPQPTLEDVTAE